MVRGIPPRYPLRRCYRSLSATPLRGSRGQQPRGAAVSAAMVAPRVDEVLRAAVVDRRSVPCHLRGGGSVAVCRSLEGRATHAPPHPAPLARGIANALPSLPSPPQGWRSREAKSSPPHHRENLGPLKWGLRGFGRRGRLWAKRRGRIWAQGGFGLARCARIWVRSFGICHLFVTGTYFHPFFGTLLERLNPYLSEKCAPRDSNPEPID